MPRTCTVCGHPERAAIERELVGRASMRAIARRYNVGREALTRHVDAGHVPVATRDAYDAGELERGEQLMADLGELKLVTRRILEGALAGKMHVGPQELSNAVRLVDDDGHLVGLALPKVALQAVKELRATLELEAKLEGELPAGDELVQVEVVFTDDWRTGG